MYKTTNWSAYNDALKQRGSLTISFDPEMARRVQPTGKRGRQQSFRDAAIQTCLTIKMLFGTPLRQTTGFVQSLLKLTGNNIGEASVPPDLLHQIAADEQTGFVTADGAHDIRKCHEAIAARGAAAVIPPRKNDKPWKPTSPGDVARKEALRASKYLGRAIRRRWSGDYRRSRVESKKNCIKLHGQSLMARDFDGQVTELQVRIVVRNGYTALGMRITVAVG